VHKSNKKESLINASNTATRSLTDETYYIVHDDAVSCIKLDLNGIKKVNKKAEIRFKVNENLILWK